jgi:NAD(P)-dependent dehydrogenase (short-subunit alcohol dehydrogenase family)
MSRLVTRTPTALVTGASRGVGKGIAIALAAAGYDLVITARTVSEGSARSPETGEVLEGSLEATASAVEAHGRRCTMVPMDLLDLEALPGVVDTAFDAAGGRLDLVVNNAIYAGPGNDRRFAEVDVDVILARVTGNLTAQLLITRHALQRMLALDVDPASGSRGTFLNITSAAGQHTPRQVAGEGGWSLVYAATKAGFHRIADMLALEYGDQGIKALNLNPGFVATERVLAAGQALEFVAKHGITPAQVGAAAVRILADPSIANGAYLHATDHLAPSTPGGSADA